MSDSVPSAQTASCKRSSASSRLSVAGAVVARSDPGKGDWPMWGGTPDRNLVSSMKDLPTSWDIKTKKNMKWVAELGSQAYGNPVVANGIVLVGTNNEAMQDPAVKGDKGVLMAFQESDGSVPVAGGARQAGGRPRQRLAVPGHLLVAARRERHRLLRVEPRRSDGGRHRRLPRQGRTTARSRTRSSTRETDVDIIWRYDMMDELGVLQHNMANSSPVICENLIYVSTSNGQDESHVNVPSPKSPAIIARRQEHRQARVGRQLGRATRSCTASGPRPPSARLATRSRSSSARATAGCAATKPRRGKKLWEFDLNPKDSVWPKTRNEVISTPVIYENVVYIANGQDPEHGEGVGHLYAIDPTKTRRHHQDRPASGTTTRSAARSRPARSTTASSSIRTSAASCTRSTSRPASRSGPTTCSRPSGARRSSSTARSISETRTATSRSSTPTGR